MPSYCYPTQKKKCPLRKLVSQDSRAHLGQTISGCKDCKASTEPPTAITISLLPSPSTPLLHRVPAGFSLLQTPPFPTAERLPVVYVIINTVSSVKGQTLVSLCLLNLYTAFFIRRRIITYMSFRLPLEVNSM